MRVEQRPQRRDLPAIQQEFHNVILGRSGKIEQGLTSLWRRRVVAAYGRRTALTNPSTLLSVGRRRDQSVMPVVPVIDDAATVGADVTEEDERPARELEVVHRVGHRQNRRGSRLHSNQ